MADNTDEEQLDKSTNTQSENLPGEIIPAAATDTINSNQETENMEVHHHAHDPAAPHHKKNWKSYFWEFLMLFLAVFCGFLAEYQLEHKIEKDRAKELAKSFYQELKNDSITVELKVRNRFKQEAALQYLIKYFRDSSLTNTSKTFAINFEYGINFRSPTLFEPRTIMLDQLRNSGSLRYFKNEDFQNLAGELTVAIKNVYDRQDLESEQRLRYINPILIQHYDWNFDEEMRKNSKNIFEGIQKYEKNNELIPFHLSGIEKLDRQNAINVLSFYRGVIVSSIRQNQIQKYIDINAALLKVLREEYHLK